MSDALADFLRARRAAVRPEQVGLDSDSKRRTPGLRREEVAELAGVSVTWYTWLEQGRPIHASTDVLTAIGRALQLDAAGIEHMLELAQPTATPIDAPTQAPTALVHLIDALDPAPAYVLGPRWQYLAWNDAQQRLYPQLATAEGIERNLLWAIFADPYAKQLVVDWDIFARQSLAEFRAGTAGLLGDDDFEHLVAELQTRSPEFATWWGQHDVAQFETRIRRFEHPTAGLLTFEFQQLAPVEWPGLLVNVLLAVPGDDSADRLADAA